MSAFVNDKLTTDDATLNINFMAGKLTKQKQIRMTEGEARFIQRKSFDLDRSESWIIREALAKVYPEVFHKQKQADEVDGNETDKSRKKVA